MALDPQVRFLLDQLAHLNTAELADWTPEQAREAFDQVEPPGSVPAPAGAIVDLMIPGPAGDLAARGLPAAAGQAPLPTMVFFHGGGWVIGNLETHDSICRALTNASGSLVVAVAYRLAPEHKFPAAVDDLLLALGVASQPAL